MTCGTTPPEYYCRPIRSWTISGYYGATKTKRCGDQCLGNYMVHAGEGRLRVTGESGGTATFYDNGVFHRKSLHGILSQTKERFFFVHWEKNGDGDGGVSIGGRYGLVRRIEGVLNDTRQEWNARITPELLQEFRSWLESDVLTIKRLPAIVADTLRYAIEKNFDLPSTSGE